jgi:hypothetical protein
MGYRTGSGAVAMALATAAAGMALTAGPGSTAMAAGRVTAQAGSGPASVKPAPVGHWGAVREVQGAAAQSLDDSDAEVSSVSCASPGNCGGGGSFSGTGYVISERSGVWSKALLMPGGPGVGSSVALVSCPAAGDCVAGGGFSRDGAPQQAFVVSETNGSWGAASALPGTAGSGAISTVSAVSCATRDACVAAGTVSMGGVTKPFVSDERGGVWGAAQGLPGLDDRNLGRTAAIESLSCASPGNCAVGGFYADQTRATHAFVATEKDGTWGQVLPLVPDAALGAVRVSQVTQMSCPSPGDCAAAGAALDAGAQQHAFIATEVSGTWGRAQPVAGLAALSAGRTSIGGVSCGSAGNCAAVGGYLDAGNELQAFAAAESGGTWHAARRVTGTGALAGSPSMAAERVDCASAGNCQAVGTATVPGTVTPAFALFAVSESGGRWGKAVEIPGSVTSIDGGNGFDSVSCAPAGNCAAGGFLTDTQGLGHSFVADDSAVTATVLGLKAAKAKFGREQAERISVKVTSRTGGTPGGKVAVKAGSRIICVITLHGGKGSCTLAAKKLRPGGYRITAGYRGSGTYSGSASKPSSLTVTR